MNNHRREFIKKASILSAIPLITPITDALAAEGAKTKHKVLIRSAWQTVNIGDIGHTFGILALFKQYLPEVEVVLWPKLIDRGVDALLAKTFPKVKILPSSTGFGPNSPELRKAFNECSFMVHGSGPYVTAYKDLQSWWNETKKPYGIYGVSLDEVSPEVSELIDKASFIHCRDTESLKYLKTLNLKCPVQEFGPDATFAIDVLNEPKAEAYLQSVGLKQGEFICVIPRLRYTPYWQMKGIEPNEEDKRRYAISLQHKQIDAEKLRQVVTDWVQKTGLKVLICAEVTYQVDLGKEVIYDPLPDDIKKNVVWRDSFWLPDEATSVYKRSKALVAFEPHSPIMAFHQGIPSIHLKQPTDTRKGQMWRDVGLGDWYFLIDETPASQISTALLKLHNNYAESLKTMEKAKAYVIKVQKDNMSVIKRSLPTI
ncbi:polysaccharide pyruvyl transferase family protein [Mucilaginibacter terrae]|uniref:polysaccharide pyruvyl transferase family protein n=1 Tax=Mucilaginibacter terrae TaxID=1955052 RepID=UPI00363EE88A